MSESYILHDVMRKVKADGLFDSIRRDLISDIEQKQSYLDLKSQIESLMSSYLSEHKWSSSLKKSDIRERARRHIESSDLVKDTLPTLVSQYMQACQEQLVQPRLASFVSDHIQHVYNSIGGTHIYQPPPSSFTPSNPTPQELSNQEKPLTPPVKQEPIATKPVKASQPPSTIPKKPPTSSLPNKAKPQPAPPKPVKEEKKPRPVSPVHSPNDLVDISPSPPSMENERTIVSLSPSPPPPVVRIASPLALPTKTETPKKAKHPRESTGESSSNKIKRKKLKIDDSQSKIVPDEKHEDIPPKTNESDTRKLRLRRPNPKYSTEQFETGDLLIIESPLMSSTTSKTRKSRSLKSSTNFEKEPSPTPAPSSPPPPPPDPTPTSIEPTNTVADMSPEYGTSLPVPAIEESSQLQQQQSLEEPQTDSKEVEERSRTPSPTPADAKKPASPRRLRPRRFNERATNQESQAEKIVDVAPRPSVKTRESIRHKVEQTNQSTLQEDADAQKPLTTKKTRLSSSSSIESNSKELPTRSISMPENIATSTDETRVSPSPMTAGPVSKSFIWKPKISK